MVVAGKSRSRLVAFFLFLSTTQRKHLLGDGKLVRMSCVKTVSDFQQIALEGTSHVAHQTGFFFNMPESIMLPSYEKNMPQSLPPSIRVQKPVVHVEQENYRSTVSGNCDVSYHIEARALMGGQLVCHTSREIIVI